MFCVVTLWYEKTELEPLREEVNKFITDNVLQLWSYQSGLIGTENPRISSVWIFEIHWKYEEAFRKALDLICNNYDRRHFLCAFGELKDLEE